MQPWRWHGDWQRRDAVVSPWGVWYKMEVDMILAIAGLAILAALGASAVLDGLRSKCKVIRVLDRNWNRLTVKVE